MKPLKIGDITIENGLVLAPMAGYTDRAMRLVCHECGAEFSYTEMVSAKAVCFGPRESYGQRSLVGCPLRGRTESDRLKQLSSRSSSSSSEELKESCIFFCCLLDLLLFKKPTSLCFIGILHLRCSKIFAIHQM